MILSIAFRNVLRNRRRTILNLVMIAGACAAIINFEGIGEDTVKHLEDVAINSQYGHIQVASTKHWEPAAKDRPRDRLMESDPKLASQIAAIPSVAYTSGRIGFFGLISNGEQSLSARGLGFDPEVETKMRDNTRIISGKNLSGKNEFQVLLGSGLQRHLGVEVGASITLLSYTFEGTVNAIDAELVGIFQTGVSEIDDNTFYLPLQITQKLLDTDKVDTLVVQLKQTVDTDATRASIAKLIPGATEARPWHQLAKHYQKVRALCDVINRVTETILVLLAILAVGNTIGMSITERIGEIGIMRAQGDRRSDIVKLFLSEGLVLGVIGGALGCVVGIIIGHLVTKLGIPLETPGNSAPTTIGVDVQARFLVFAFFVTCTMAMLATALPAMRASRYSIVDALKRNI